MMSDMTFLSPSPWLNDFPLMKDGLLPESDVLSDLPFDVLDNDTYGLETGSLSNWGRDWDVPSSYQSSEISVANSECSDEHSLDIDGALEDTLLQNIGDREFLSSTIVNTPLGHSRYNDLAESVDIHEVGKAWSDNDDDDDDIWERLSNADYSPSLEPRERTLEDLLNHSVQWDSLSGEERRVLVEELSTMVSRQLGLREQLEIIRIINPHAKISPMDTEFAIDMSCLTNEKLREVYTFLRQLTDNEGHNCYHDTAKSRSRSPHHHGNHSNQGSRLFSHHGSMSDSESINSTQSKKTRKRTQLTHRRRASAKQKRARQQLKEQRSGLFKQEQKVAVESTGGEELDDIDILT